MQLGNEMLSHVTDQIKDRLKSPLVLFFAIGWLHTNYDLVLYITSLQLGADAKIELIKKYNMLSTTNMFWYPLGTALALYLAWYFLDALSKGLMEKHNELVRVIASHFESLIHKIDTPKNKIRQMENIISQLNGSYLSEKLRSDFLQQKAIDIIKAIITQTSSGYELNKNEVSILHKSDSRYFVAKGKDRMDDTKFKEFKQRLEKFQAVAINQYRGDGNLLVVDIGGITDAVPKDVIAEMKYFGLEITDRVSTLQ